MKFQKNFNPLSVAAHYFFQIFSPLLLRRARELLTITSPGRVFTDHVSLRFQVEEEARASPEGECGRPSHPPLHHHPNGGGVGGPPLLIPVTSAAVATHLLQPPPPNAVNNHHPLHASIGVTATGSASEDDEGSSTPSSGHHSLSHTTALTPNAHHGKRRSITRDSD